jgi:glycoside hydrolase-like protein
VSIEGVDYAWSRPPPAGLAAAGKRFACRYLSNSFTGKNLTASEATALTRAGVAVVSNWEWRAGDAKLGYSAGVSYARTALAQALACGMPPSRPIYFSVDWDATSTELRGPVTAYLQGVASVLGVARTGVYGSYDTVDWASRNGLARWLWQTYAWSGGRWHPAAQIQQYRNGVTVAGVADIDLDRAMVADYGQWLVGQAAAEEIDVDEQQDRRLTNVDSIDYFGDVLGQEDVPLVLPDPADPNNPAKFRRSTAKYALMQKLNALVSDVDHIKNDLANGVGLAPTQEQVDAAVRNALTDPNVVGPLVKAVNDDAARRQAE